MTQVHCILRSFFLLSLFVSLHALAAPAGQIQSAKGSVWIVVPGAPEHGASSGDAVDQGMTVRTEADSQAVIRFQDGQVVALKSNSLFQVRQYKFDKDKPEAGSIFFSLVKGGLRAITGLIGEKNRPGWKLATPVVTIGIRGTDFLAAIQQGVYTHVNLGAISMTNDGGTAALGVAQFGFAPNAATLSTAIPASAVPAGLFGELEAITISGVAGGGAAAGAGTAATGGISGATWGAIGVIGVGAAAAVAAGGGGGNTATTHH